MRRRHTPEQIITALREAEVGLANGKTVGELKLDSPCVWDGLAAAGGNLLVSLTNGKIVCLGR